MTVESSCYVCGKEGLCINGLCPDCTMRELFQPGRAFAATFGSLGGQFQSEVMPSESDQDNQQGESGGFDVDELPSGSNE